MVSYKKIDKDTVEKTETVVEIIKISNVSEEIKTIEREITFLTDRLKELKVKETALLEAK